MVKANISIYLSPQTCLTVADIKQWLQAVSNIGVPDDHPLYVAELGLDYVIDAHSITQISCGQCQPQFDNSDILITKHHCGS